MGDPEHIEGLMPQAGGNRGPKAPQDGNPPRRPSEWSNSSGSGRSGSGSDSDRLGATLTFGSFAAQVAMSGGPHFKRRPRIAEEEAREVAYWRLVNARPEHRGQALGEYLDMAPEEAFRFGVASVPPPPEHEPVEAKAARVDRWMAYHFSPRMAQDYRFETFDLDLNPLARRVYEAAVAFARQNAPPWLVLVGPYGTGKSHLAMAAARVWAESGWRVIYYRVNDALDALRKGMPRPDDDQESTEAVKERLMTPGLLVLDEWGQMGEGMVQEGRTTGYTAWEGRTLESLVLSRYGRQLPTVICVNDTAHLGERLESRVNDPGLAVVALAGDEVDGTWRWAEDARPLLKR